jgi:hypothetical protein
MCNQWRFHDKHNSKICKGDQISETELSRLGDRARREPFGATGEKARGESERRAGPEGEEDEHVAYRED